MKRQAKAPLRPIRQSSQYNCMCASMSMCLEAIGVPPEECTTELVNKVMGAQPMKGAAWEQALACSQHYGAIATLRVPSTVRQLKEWTDQGVAVMIAWNPHDRDWSHASVVFDVTEDEAGELTVHVADPNCPDPEQTTVVMSAKDFYDKWYEKWPSYLVRRPAMAVEREISREGRQMKASLQTAVGDSLVPVCLGGGIVDPEAVADRYLEARAKKKKKPRSEKDKLKIPKAPKGRDPYAQAAKERKTTPGHKRRERGRAVERGHSRKPKHKGQRSWAASVNNVVRMRLALNKHEEHALGIAAASRGWMDYSEMVDHLTMSLNTPRSQKEQTASAILPGLVRQGFLEQRGGERGKLRISDNGRRRITGSVKLGCTGGACSCGGSCGCSHTEYPSNTGAVAEPVFADPSNIAARFLRGDPHVPDSH